MLQRIPRARRELTSLGLVDHCDVQRDPLSYDDTVVRSPQLGRRPILHPPRAMSTIAATDGRRLAGRCRLDDEQVETAHHERCESFESLEVPSCSFEVREEARWSSGSSRQKSTRYQVSRAHKGAYRRKDSTWQSGDQ